MCIRIAAWMIVLMVGLAGSASLSQTDGAAPAARTAAPQGDPYFAARHREIDQQAATSSKTPESVSPMESRAEQSYWSSVNAYYLYQAYSFRYSQAAFEWHHRASITIFIVVVMLVFMGMYFSWAQFRGILYRDSHFKGQDNCAESEQSASALSRVTELVITPSGVKVRSPVLGVVLLVLSLAFFYLYLTHVYPITTLGESQAPQSPVIAQQAKP